MTVLREEYHRQKENGNAISISISALLKVIARGGLELILPAPANLGLQLNVFYFKINRCVFLFLSDIILILPY